MLLSCHISNKLNPDCTGIMQFHYTSIIAFKLKQDFVWKESRPRPQIKIEFKRRWEMIILKAVVTSDKLSAPCAIENSKITKMLVYCTVWGKRGKIKACDHSHSSKLQEQQCSSEDIAAGSCLSGKKPAITGLFAAVRRLQLSWSGMPSAEKSPLNWGAALLKVTA